MADDEERTQTRWERLEDYLFDYERDGSDFSAREYANEYELGMDDASLDIQAYLRAQRAVKSNTLYVLRRVPKTRTSNSRWAVGTRTRDAKLIGRGLAEDTKRRVERAFQPDLVRLRQLNRRAARRVEIQISAVIDGAMTILAAAAEGMQSGDEDDE